MKHSKFFYKNWETFSGEKFGWKDENFSIKNHSDKGRKLFSNSQNHRKTPLFSRVLACFCSTWNGRSKSNCSTWNIGQINRFSAFSLRYCVFYCLFLRICFSSVLRVECYWFNIPLCVFSHVISHCKITLSAVVCVFWIATSHIIRIITTRTCG